MEDLKELRKPTARPGYSFLLLVVVVIAACRSSAGPPAEEVKKAAEALFERAARGETVAGIQFTAQGTAAPRLIASEIRARRKVSGQESERFEYEVRLTYLNRIQQMEWGNVTVRFERRGDSWVAVAE